MLKNILAVIGAVTVAAAAYVAFSDHGDCENRTR